MQAEMTGLIEDGGRVAGLHAATPEGSLEVRADLVVGADGRNSTVRARAGLEVTDLGAPIDVLWMRVSRRPSDPGQTLGRVAAGRFLVMLNRGTYWQCGYLIRKGAYDALRAGGIAAFQENLAALAPHLRDRVSELASWDDVKVLTVKVDRLRRWHRPGLLCIGDAAHAMSPVGGVGINLAIQDAVAAANVLAPALRRGAPGEADLEAVQRRRTWPTAMTQRAQVLIQDRMITRVLSGSGGGAKLPWPLRLFQRYPVLRRIPARMVGMGLRPEHVRVEAAPRP
jgi:2-polyprenyl-6-methoxyphenol hydroxylase-like FAD-dependent oxidoreductase